jgi:hypothetical protein
MYGPLGHLYGMFVVYQDQETALAIQKKILVFLCDNRSKTKEMDNHPVQLGVKFVAR